MPLPDLFRALSARVPAEALYASEAVREQFALGGSLPEVVAFPTSEEEVAATVQTCAELGAAVVPWGGGARQRQMPPPWRYDVALVLRRMNRVLAYDPEDLTLTVETGCTVEEIAAVLQSRRQWLLADVALPASSTIGGLVASAAAGLSHSGRISVRDLLLGLTFVTGEGVLVRGGGRVVKNVAGYDLMRLLAGSWGTLGVVTRATLKVLPVAQSAALAWIVCPSLRDAAECARACAGDLPEPATLALLSAARSSGGGAVEQVGVLVGYQGSSEEVEEARVQLRARVPESWGLHEGARAEELFCTMRDFPLRAPEGRWAAGIRLALPPAESLRLVESIASRLEEVGASVCVLPQRGTVYVRFRAGGETACMRALRWLVELSASARGWAVPDWWPDNAQWDAPELPHLFLSRRVKETLDPRGVLNPGRYWRHW